MADGGNPFDIPDSSDWLNTPLASFAQVESGLRCQVCKDFYKTPMITACGHTFCSLCIRHCYSSDHKCPACRAAGQETQLRRNGALEELVEAFQNARTTALNFARQSPLNARSAFPKRKLDALVEEEEPADRPSKRTRSSSRRNAEPALSTESEGKTRETISLLDDDGDGEYKPASDLVKCPICEHRVKAATINSHLDSDCPPKPRPHPSSTLGLVVSKSSRQSSSSTSKPAPARLPYLSYNGMKEPALRKKLTELGISSYGSKIEMQKRHTEWVAIWNSNCDAKHPRSPRDLRTDLDIWERTQGSLASKSSGGIGSAIKDDNFDGPGWAATHQNDYKDLIAKARQKRQAPKSNPTSTPQLSTPIPSSDGNHEAAYQSPYSHRPQENASRPQNGSLTRAEVSLMGGLEVAERDGRPVELPVMKAIEPNGIEPPWPSSQVSHLKDEPTSSQFTISPGSKRFFEDVDDPIVDTNLGITSHH